MKKIFLFWLGLQTLGLHAWGIELVEPGWEKISEDDGVKVYKKEIPGDPFIAFRGEGFVEASTIKVASMMGNLELAKEWIDSLDEIKVIRKISDYEDIEYNHVGTPFVVKDRDFVLHNKVEIDPIGKTISINFRSVEDPDAPKTNYIRGEVHSSSFILKSFGEEKTYFICEVHADPKGSLAAWMVNMFQKKWPRNTINAIREQMKKPNIKILPQFEHAFKPKVSSGLAEKN